MKRKILFLSLVFILTSFQIVAQTWNCDTKEPNQDFLFQNGVSNYSSSNSAKSLDIFIHVIRKSDGSGGLSTSQVNNAISKLYNDFKNTNICFNIKGSDFINNTYYYNFTDSKFDNLITVNLDANAINLYLLPILPSSINFGGKASGIPGKALVIDGEYVETSVLAHEMGHCLGLYHTHSGRGCNDFVNCSEPVNGSNCNDCGDRVCDTPADPCLSGNVNNECIYTGGGGFFPLTNNIQSYTSPNCMDKFTVGQISRMHTIINNASFLQSTLNCLYCNTSSPEWTYSNILGWIFNLGNNWYYSNSADGNESVNKFIYVNSSQDFCSAGIWGYTTELGWIYYKDANGANYIRSLDKWVYFNSEDVSGDNGVWFYTHQAICGLTGWFYAKYDGIALNGHLLHESAGWINWINCSSNKVNTNSTNQTLTQLTYEENDLESIKEFNKVEFEKILINIPNNITMEKSTEYSEPTDAHKIGDLTEHLSTNIFPNPAANSTNIEFDLPTESLVNISIFDLTGKKVETIENDNMRDKGKHTIKFDTQQLANGVYSVHIQTDEFTSTKKIIIAR